jgi:type II secretory pathway pseudopilin PulG
MTHRRQGERGHLMVAVMVAVAILLILSTVAYQAWEDMVRRELEAEMIFRAQDICRALKRYREDHAGQLPLELKLLMEPGSKGQYYLRQLWKDPLVKGGEWGKLYASPQGGVIDPNAAEQTEPAEQAEQTEQTEQTGEGKGGGKGKGEGKSRIGTQSSRRSSDPGSARLGLGGEGGTQDIGGLPIAGVKSLCTKKAFRVINDESEYALWLFTVFDLDVPGRGQQAGGGAAGGATHANPNQGGKGSDSSKGSGFKGGDESGSSDGSGLKRESRGKSTR